MPPVKSGYAGRRTVRIMFKAWTAWKEKRIARPTLQAQLEPACMALYRALERGRAGPDKKLQRFLQKAAERLRSAVAVREHGGRGADE